MIDRARGSDSGAAGPQRDAAASAAGRLRAAGPTGAGKNEARTAGPDYAPAISLGLTHRIYPDGQAVAVISGELDAATADRAQEYVRQVIDRSRGPRAQSRRAPPRHRQDHAHHGGGRQLPRAGPAQLPHHPALTSRPTPSRVPG